MLHACSSAVLVGTERIAPEEVKLTEKLSRPRAIPVPIPLSHASLQAHSLKKAFCR